MAAFTGQRMPNVQPRLCSPQVDSWSALPCPCLRGCQVAISPWIDAQTVSYPTSDNVPMPSSQCEHTSVINTVNNLLGVKDTPLSKRVEWSGACRERCPSLSPP